MQNSDGAIRDMFYRREAETLSKYAFLTQNTRGRDYPCEPCTNRTEFQRDRDRIIHSKAFRRLMHKTQVFLLPVGEHYRTRLTHTLEVAQIARIIARALMLNEDLCEAAALGHDLGHTPFGHAGEIVMQQCYSRDFTHYRQSLRVVEKLENEEDDDDYIVVSNRELDLDELVNEEVSLSLPNKILCKDDCKGLCPKCGANLNVKQCNCKKDVDPRMEALLQLLEDE